MKRPTIKVKKYVLQTRVTEELRGEFWEIVSALDKTESEAMREAIEEYIYKRRKAL